MSAFSGPISWGLPTGEIDLDYWASKKDPLMLVVSEKHGPDEDGKVRVDLCVKEARELAAALLAWANRENT